MRYIGIFQIMEPRNQLKADFEMSITFWTAWNFFMRFSLLCSGEWALSFYLCVFIYTGVSLSPVQQYRNDSKFSDRQVLTNNADPDQSPSRAAVWSP